MYRQAFGLMFLVAVAAAAGSAQAQETSKQDEMFVMQAASGGMAEVQAGQWAETRSQQQPVKDFAEKMVQAHTANNDELMTLAQSKGISLPAAPLPKDAATLSKLQLITGARFDTTYIRAQISGHEAMESVMEREMKSGSDSDLRAFAQKTLPVVRRHLQMARELTMTAKGG